MKIMLTVVTALITGLFFSSSAIAEAFAGLAWQATHETQKEILEEFDQYLVDKKGATYVHFGTNQFYSGKMPIAEDIIAYLLGFLFGYCQSPKIKTSKNKILFRIFCTQFVHKISV